MSDREGVIKYRLEHQLADLPVDFGFAELNAWRSIMHRLGLIGRVPDRYDGLGFGNISRRLVPGRDEFIISGTQTGHLPRLEAWQFVWVVEAVPEQNRLCSRGACQPSSEALTHAGVYRECPVAQAVIHVHSPEIWRQTAALALPHTGADIPYGTPRMAEAVADLFAKGDLQALPLFTMLGHLDGVVAFGTSLADAACQLLCQLSRAIAIEQCPPAR